jgi:hypothetical protein
VPRKLCIVHRLLCIGLLDSLIPLWATDVYFQVVYRGRLGLEDGAVAVGLKDMFKHTPMDIIINWGFFPLLMQKISPMKKPRCG